MVKEARHLVRSGRLGGVRKVVAEYRQGWLSTRLEETGHKQAAWRQDPEQAGPSSAVGDIGSHVHNLVRYVTGMRIEAVFAELATLVPGRAMEDDAAILVRFAGRARGIYTASQMAAGEDNGLVLRVYGERAAVVWRQEEPDVLHLLEADGPNQCLTRGRPYLCAAAQHASRLPPGPPRGLHRGVREHLPLGWPNDRRQDRGNETGSQGLRRSRPHGRSAGRALHRQGSGGERAGGLDRRWGGAVSRPVTLFTGQWADLPLEALAAKAAAWGYDGLELACWGDHFDVRRALADPGYCRARREMLAMCDLDVYAISNHLVGQAVCDRVDARHKEILPAHVWATERRRGVRARAAREMQDTARAAAKLGVDVVNGFTGSPVWHLLYSFPPVPREWIDRGFAEFAERWAPILGHVFGRGASGLRSRCTPPRSPSTPSPRSGRCNLWMGTLHSD